MITPDLAMPCKAPYDLRVGDNWEVAAMENKAALLDCTEKHRLVIKAIR